MPEMLNPQSAQYVALPGNAAQPVQAQPKQQAPAAAQQVQASPFKTRQGPPLLIMPYEFSGPERQSMAGEPIKMAELSGRPRGRPKGSKNKLPQPVAWTPPPMGRVSPNPDDLTAAKALTGRHQNIKTSEHAATIKEMVDAGHSPTEIASHLGVPDRVVYGYITKGRNEGQIPLREYRPDERYRKAHEMWEQGHSIRKIADQYSETGTSTPRERAWVAGIIERYRKDFGWFPPRREYPQREVPPPDEQYRLAHDLWMQGHNVRQIADHYAGGKASLIQIAKMYNLAKRYRKRYGWFPDPRPSQQQDERLDDIEDRHESFSRGILRKCAKSPVRLSREDIPALHAAAKADPHNRQHWHALADALDEIGKPYTASMIRGAADGSKIRWGGDPYAVFDEMPDRRASPPSEWMNGHMAGIPIKITKYRDHYVVRNHHNPTHENMVAVLTPENGEGVISELDKIDRRHRFSKKSNPIRLAAEDPHQAFQAAITAEPGNPVHKLNYADWLDEQGHVGLAGAIRDSLDVPIPRIPHSIGYNLASVYAKHMAAPGISAEVYVYPNRKAGVRLHGIDMSKEPLHYRSSDMPRIAALVSELHPWNSGHDTFGGIRNLNEVRRHLGLGELPLPPGTPAPFRIPEDTEDDYEDDNHPDRLKRVRMSRQDTATLWEAVKANPENPAHWHALADSMDEIGKPAHAEMLRDLATKASDISRFPHGAASFDVPPKIGSAADNPGGMSSFSPSMIGRSAGVPVLIYPLAREPWPNQKKIPHAWGIQVGDDKVIGQHFVSDAHGRQIIDEMENDDRESHWDKTYSRDTSYYVPLEEGKRLYPVLSRPPVDKLARQRAPSGGFITRGIYSKPGEFLPKEAVQPLPAPAPKRKKRPARERLKTAVKRRGRTTIVTGTDGDNVVEA